MTTTPSPSSPGSADSSSDRRALLAALLKARAEAPEEQPLSYGQQMMWFLHQLAPESSAYNVGQAVRIKGRLDRQALQAALTELVARHAVLRTAFHGKNGKPTALVHPTGRVELSFVDTPGEKSASELDRVLVADMERPFDLEHGPLLRVIVHQLAETECVLLLAMHHVVGEFWALVVLVRDLAELYSAARRGRPPQLPTLARSYADFVEAERKLLASEQGERHWAYWRDKLSGDLPVLDLPTDRPRPPAQTFAGAQHSFTLDPRLADTLLSFSRREGATPYTVLLAGFAVQLARYTGKRDLLVGTPFSRRTSAEWADVVGYFDNPLPLRVDLSGEPTFREVVQRVRKGVLEAFEHQSFPLPLLVERLNPVRDGSRPPLFNTMLVFRRAQKGATGVAALSMGDRGGSVQFSDDLEIDPHPVARRAAPMDLSLVLSEDDGQIHGYWEYNTDLFDDATMARMTDHFAQLLTRAISNPDALALHLGILTDRERHAALHQWNDTARALEANDLIHSPFDARALAHPTDTAVIANGRTYSYGWLASAADRVARWLQERGARPGQLVAVVMEKGWQQVVAVLGIVRAGAAYLPIDANLPKDRIQALLDLGEVSLALVQSSIDAPSRSRFDQLTIDEPTLHELSTGAKRCPARPEDLAYVIFTSGSTGVPKGVMIEHRAALNTIFDMNERFAVSSSDRVLALSSLSFDLSVYDIFGTLGAGAAIVIPDAERAQDPAHWAELVASARVSVWNSVPALAELVVAHVERTGSRALLSVRTIMLSGDWIPLSLPQRLRAQAPGSSVVSLGGATEASIWSILYPIEQVDPTWRSIPYGRPMANQSFYVFDDDLEPCPVGVVGELYIGGAGVARGYWADKERTEQSFLTHPGTGDYLYRTGDLGRYRVDGVIELLGRRDNQVKIRGFRVELGEIEAALTAEPFIERAVVSARKKSGGEKRLVAYVVPKAGTVVSLRELRGALERRLPDYMVPSAFVVLDTLPLSHNGKVDLAALPEPSHARPPLTSPFRAPTTDMERDLAAIWARALELDEVGIDDDFFELGGDSVLAIQVSTLAREGGIDLKPRQLFQTPTVAALSRIAARDTRERVAPPASRASSDGGHALSPMQSTMLLHAAVEGSRALYCERIVCELQGRIDSTAFARSVQRLGHAHPVLLAHFELRPSPTQVVADGVAIPLRELDWRNRSHDENVRALDALLEDERSVGFDPEIAPLIRLVLVRLSEDRAWLVVAHHHAILDGWSLTPLLRDLLDFHDQEANAPGEHTTSPRPSFFDYTAWQAQRDSAADAAFWRDALKGVAPPESLLGSPSTDSLSERFVHGEVECSVSLEASRALADFARRHGLTQSTIVVAAWGFVLGQYAGEDEVVCGVTVGGRPLALPEMNDAVGLFINTLPMRVPLPPAIGVIDWLRTLQERQAAAREHDALSVAAIQRLAGDSCSGRGFGLYETVVVYENYPIEPGLRSPARPLRVGAITFKEETGTPLTLYAFPGDAIHLRAAYDRGRFEPEDVQRALGYLATVLEQISRSFGDTRVASLSLAAPSRELEVSHVPPPPSVPSVVCAIREVGATMPDAIAIDDGGRPTTYAELLRRARAIATALESAGGRRGDIIAVALPRSVELVASVLGILDAGAAYLPLDLTWPTDRLRMVVEMAKVSIVLAPESEQARFGDAKVVPPERVTIVDSAAPRDATAPDPASAAYVICTSGSTGAPKAVVVPHASLDVFVASARAAYDVRAEDRVLQFNTLAFDASVEELFVTLSVGATLVLRNDAMIESAKAFWDGCSERQVTVAGISTSFWEMLVSDLQRCSVPSSVRLVTIGGEPARSESVVKFVNAVGSRTRLLNTYGPTEATVVATVSDLGQWVAAGARGRPPIGTPLPHVRAYILDRGMRPVPPGVPGELALGGGALATGYAYQPELTAAAFVSLPLPDGDVRVYRTGDRVKRRPDGEIDFIGRTDTQVKIRGFRVELGDVEANVSAHPDVMRAAVIATTEHDGPRRLVAFVIPRPLRTLTATAVRTFVTNRVPSFMVPSQVVVLEELPLTASGKVDKRRLRAPAPAPATDDARTPLERSVARIWGEALRVGDIGRNDNFFDRGGDSLLAVAVAARCRDALGVEVQLRTVFQYPTVAAFAEAIGAAIAPGQVSQDEALFALDAKLPDEIQPHDCTTPSRRSRPTAKVFLTGATGFLGAFLVRELLNREDTELRCLVRAKNEDEARQRVLEGLERYGIRRDGDERRIRPVCGDLAHPSLGLSHEAFVELADEVDCIIHNGAFVHAALPYARLRDANVGGTREVLRLASKSKGLPVHVVSSLSVFDGVEGAPAFTENMWPSSPHASATGYARSKVAAEWLVREAQHRGIPVTLYRPSAIIGDATTGACQSGDIISMLMAACIATKTIPMMDHPLELVPVDYVSRSLIALALDGRDTEGAFHLTSRNAIPVSRLGQWIGSFGCPVRPLPYPEFRAQLQRWSLGEGKQHPAAPLASMLPAIVARSGIVDATVTRERLASLGETIPEVTEISIHRHLGFLASLGAIPATRRGATS